MSEAGRRHLVLQTLSIRGPAGELTSVNHGVPARAPPAASPGRTADSQLEATRMQPVEGVGAGANVLGFGRFQDAEAFATA